MANAAGNSVWIIAAGLLALFALALGLYAAREREALRVALAQGGEREAKLRALALLDSLTEGSTDSIFARDLQGRFLLRNRAALEALPFKSAGGDSLQDLALPEAEIAQLRANDLRVINEGRTISLVEQSHHGQGPPHVSVDQRAAARRPGRGDRRVRHRARHHRARAHRRRTGAAPASPAGAGGRTHRRTAAGGGAPGAVGGVHAAAGRQHTRHVRLLGSRPALPFRQHRLRALVRPHARADDRQARARRAG